MKYNLQNASQCHIGAVCVCNRRATKKGNCIRIQLTGKTVNFLLFLVSILLAGDDGDDDDIHLSLA